MAIEGFQLFDAVHLKWLVALSCFTIGITLLYRFTTFKKFLLQLLFLTLLSLEIAKQFYLFSTNQYTFYSPPLHLCGIGIFLSGLYAYKPSRITSTLLFSLTYPGVLIALIFPGWATDPVGSFLHFHSFLFHGILVAFITPLVVYHVFDIRVADLMYSVMFLCLFVPFLYAYNKTFQTNFMFLNKPVVNTPLQLLYDTFGSNGYIMSLIVVLLILWVVQYNLYFLYKKMTGERFHLPY